MYLLLIDLIGRPLVKKLFTEDWSKPWNSPFSNARWVVNLTALFSMHWPRTPGSLCKFERDCFGENYNWTQLYVLQTIHPSILPDHYFNIYQLEASVSICLPAVSAKQTGVFVTDFHKMRLSSPAVSLESIFSFRRNFRFQWTWTCTVQL